MLLRGIGCSWTMASDQLAEPVTPARVGRSDHRYMKMPRKMRAAAMIAAFAIAFAGGVSEAQELVPASYTPAIVLVLEIGVAVSVALALLSMFVGVLRNASGTQDR